MKLGYLVPRLIVETLFNLMIDWSIDRLIDWSIDYLLFISRLPIYPFIHLVYRGNKAMFGLFFSTTKKAAVFASDTVRTNQMPNLTTMYQTERLATYVYQLGNIDCVSKMIHLICYIFYIIYIRMGEKWNYSLSKGFHRIFQ